MIYSVAKFFTLASFLLNASVHTATNPGHYGSGGYNVNPSPRGTVDEVDYFRQNAVIDEDSKIMETNHYGLFLAVKNQQHKQALISFIRHTQEAPYTTQYLSAKDLKSKSYAEKISDVDVKSCLSDHACNLIKELFFGIKSASLSEISEKCLKAVVDQALLNISPMDVKNAIAHLPNNVLESMGSTILGQLDAKVTEIAVADFNRLMKTPASCGSITKKGWEALLQHTLAKNVTPMCIYYGRAAFALADPTMSNKIAQMQKDVFQNYNDTATNNVFQSLKPEQFKGYARIFEEGEFPGQNFSMTLLMPAQAVNLTTRILMGYLDKNAGLFTEKKVWAKIPSNIFSKVNSKDAETITKAINGTVVQPDNMKVVRVLNNTQLSDLMQHHVFCESLDATAFTKRNNKIEISKECFQAMPPTTQAAVLLTNSTILPNDVMDAVSQATVKSYSYGDFTSFAAVMNKFAAGAKKNRLEIIHNMGSLLHQSHPCRELSMDNLKESKNLTPLISAHCYDNLDFHFEAEDFKDKIVSRLFYLQRYIHLKQTQKKQWWENLSKDNFAVMVKGGKFCKAVDQDIIPLIKDENFAAIDYNCFTSMAVVDQMTPAVIQKMDPAIFGKVSKSQVNAPTMAKMSSAQLVSLGSEVPEASSNPASNFNKEILDIVSDQDIAKVSENAWKAMPASAYASIAAAPRLAAIQPASTASWSEDAVKAVPAAVMGTLSEAQAENIGSSATNSPLTYFSKMSEMNEAARKVINRRLNISEAGPAEEEGWSTMTIVLVVVGIIVVLAGIGAAVYFTMFSN